MAGVTILGSEVVMTENPLGFTFAMIGIGFLFLALAFGIIFKNENYGLPVMLILGGIGTFFGFGGIIYAETFEVEDYTKYDVLVSENVMFQEFYNKYEILDAKGQIYTVKEIELDD